MMVVGYQPWGTDVKNPDFGAIAQAAGMHGERVEHAATSGPPSPVRSSTTGRRSSTSSPTRVPWRCRPPPRSSR